MFKIKNVADTDVLLALLIIFFWLLTVYAAYVLVRSYRKRIESRQASKQLATLKDELPEHVYYKQLAEISTKQSSGLFILLSSCYTLLMFFGVFGATVAFFMHIL